MTVYSHSRICTFEQCKYKYKLQYIDKVKVDMQTTIEAFLGDMVHRTLEKLYKDLNYEKLNSISEILTYYDLIWDREYTEDILIVKKNYTAENYKAMGEKYLKDYYEKYKPFDDMTIIGLETQDKMTLKNGDKYHVRIDKLGFNGTTYYVTDYKTNNSMKTQEDADADRQLAMYSLWVKDKFPDAKRVVLKWYMLAFNKEVVSERSDEELEKLEKEVVQKIEEIEKCSDFPTQTSGLCNYCQFKEICPAFTHEVELDEKSNEEFKKDRGVRLVDAYAALSHHKKKIDSDLEKIKNNLIEFAKTKEIEMVYGSESKVSVKTIKKIELPEEKENLITYLKKKNLYDEYSTLNYMKLNSSAIKGEINLEKFVDFKEDYRVSLSKKKEEEEE